MPALDGGAGAMDSTDLGLGIYTGPRRSRGLRPWQQMTIAGGVIFAVSWITAMGISGAFADYNPNASRVGFAPFGGPFAAYDAMNDSDRGEGGRRRSDARRPPADRIFAADRRRWLGHRRAREEQSREGAEMRSLVAISTMVMLLGTSCGDTVTCGRGRCPRTSECVNVFTNQRQNDGLSTKRYPNVDGEWWCKDTCADGMACDGECLTDPADSNVVVCATNRVEVRVFAASATLDVPLEGNSTACYPVEVTGVSMSTSCTSGATTAGTCPADRDCILGQYSAGQVLPDPKLITTVGESARFCLGRSGESLRLSSALPEGVPIRIYVTPTEFANCPSRSAF